MANRNIGPLWAAFLVCVIIGGVYCVMNPSVVANWAGQFPGQGNQQVPSVVTTTQVLSLIGEPKSALYKIGVKDASNSTYLTTAICTPVVDVIFKNSFDTRHESLAIASAAQTSSKNLIEGQDVYFHVYATNHYSRVFHAVMAVSAVVYLVVPVYDGATSFTLKEIPVGQIGWDDSATHYWLLPAFDIWNRAPNTNARIDAGSGQSGATVVGTTASAPDALISATDTNKYTATSKTFTNRVMISLTAVSVAWGEPVLLISSGTPRTFKASFMIFWAAFNNTALNDDTGPFSQGFRLIGIQPTGYRVFWKVLVDPSTDGAVLRSSEVTTASYFIDIPVDSTAIGATVISCRYWCADFQVPSSASAGSSSAAPTTYNPFSGFGVTATIAANGYATTSNVPSGDLEYTIFTTAA